MDWSTAFFLARTALEPTPYATSELVPVRMGENAAFKVADAPVLVRVARPEVADKAVRVVSLSRALLQAGVPVAEPVDLWPEGNVQGTVSTWRWLDTTPGPFRWEDFGRALRSLHMAEVDAPSWAPLGNVYRRLEAAPTSRARSHLLAAADVVFGEIRRLDVPQVLVHADAHDGNALMCPDGMVLIDLDDVGYGPMVVDLAPTLVATRRFGLDVSAWEGLCRGYGVSSQPTQELEVMARMVDLILASWLVGRSGESARVDREIDVRVRTLGETSSHTLWTSCPMTVA